MEKAEILLEIKKAEDTAKKIIADAEENYKKRLVELDLEMEKQRAISEGVREIEKVREQALEKKEEAINFILDKFMRYIDELQRKND